LLRFDPLLAQTVIVQHHDKRLSATKEEDDFEADFKLKLPKQEPKSNNESLEDQASNTFESSSSAQDQPLQNLLPIEDEMSLSVDIMKDIIVENKPSEHIEETKLR
jgi:hypothetical protein